MGRVICSEGSHRDAPDLRIVLAYLLEAQEQVERLSEARPDLWPLLAEIERSVSSALAHMPEVK